MKPKTIISILLIVIATIIYAPYIYILQQFGKADLLSIIGTILSLTVVLLICTLLLGKYYKALE